MKYKIEKRKDHDNLNWSTKTWPWVLRYPNGRFVYCFGYDSAMEIMKMHMKANKRAVMDARTRLRWMPENYRIKAIAEIIR